MKKRLKFAISAAVACMGIYLGMVPLSAKPEFSKKEKTGWYILEHHSSEFPS